MKLLALGLALDGNDVLTIELVAGGEVQGYAVGGDEEGITVTWDNQRTTVPWDLVESVQVNGESISVPEIKTEAAQLGRSDEPLYLRAPAPFVVGTASMIWPGSGHLLLGDRRSFLAYSGVEFALLGVAAWQIYDAQSLGPLVPLAALDLLFRVYSAVEATDEARGRRESVRLGLSSPPALGLTLILSDAPGNTLRGRLD